MVCIAAFIILAIVGVVVAFLSIFNRNLGKKYWKIFKKSFHCFGKRVRLQKCDTNFSEDVKTAVLKKVVIKKPKLVKPLSIALEIASFLIVVATIWSLIEGVKAGLALWTLGTCNVSQPSNCALGADSCSIDEDNLNWFTEWGEIFSNIPDRLKSWNAEEYINGDIALETAFVVGNLDTPATLSIIDPGCSVCMQSYKNIKNSDFLGTHKLAVVLYPIKNTDGSYRFKNSELITRYILSVDQSYAEKIINRIFTEYNAEHINYQEVFNNQLDSEQAKELLSDWLAEWGMDETSINEIKTNLYSEDITAKLEHNSDIINQQIRPKGIPTMIYDGKKHLGLYK